MTGPLSWLATGAIVAAIARVIPRGRRGWIPEALGALIAAAFGGLVATLLDFGGTAVMDPRAIALAAALSAAAVALTRVVARSDQKKSRALRRG